MKSQSLKNNLLAITACLLWSTAFVGVKVGLRYMPPLTLAGMRFILAGLLLLPFSGGLKHLANAAIHNYRTVLVVSLFQSILLYGTFFIAMQFVDGAVAAIVIGSSPMISALVAHVMMHDDKLTARNVFAISLGISGIVIVTLSCKPWAPVGLREFGGILLLLLGSVISGIGNVFVAKKKNAIHPVALNCSQIFIGGIVLLSAGLYLEGLPNMAQPLTFYKALLWLAALSAVGFSIWFHLLTRIKVSKLNIWKFLIPVFGAATSWWLLPDESPTLWAIIGLLFVTAGITVAYARRPQSGAR